MIFRMLRASGLKPGSCGLRAVGRLRAVADAGFRCVALPGSPADSITHKPGNIKRNHSKHEDDQAKE